MKETCFRSGNRAIPFAYSLLLVLILLSGSLQTVQAQNLDFRNPALKKWFSDDSGLKFKQGKPGTYVETHNTTVYRFGPKGTDKKYKLAAAEFQRTYISPNSFTLEFGWRAGENFLWGDLINFDKRIKLHLEWRALNLYCTAENTRQREKTKKIKLAEGSGPRSSHYYLDGKWHHFAIVYQKKAPDGKDLKLYIDGVNPEGFAWKLQYPLGYSLTHGLYISDKSKQLQDGDYAGLGLYKKALSPSQIWAHYQDFQQGSPYRKPGGTRLNNVPRAVPGSQAGKPISINRAEFPDGYQPTVKTKGNRAAFIRKSKSFEQQLMAMPDPRYHPLNKPHEIIPTPGQVKLVGEDPPAGKSSNQVIAEIFTELARTFNYALFLGPATLGTPQKLKQENNLTKALIANARRHPQYKRSLTLFWRAVNPAEAGLSTYRGIAPGAIPNIRRKDLTQDMYYRENDPRDNNPNDDFMNILGTMGCGGLKKAKFRFATPSRISLAAPDLTYFKNDGKAMAFAINNIQKELGDNRPIDFLFENGECQPAALSEQLGKCLAQPQGDGADAQVHKSFQASRLSWYQWQAKRKLAFRSAYRDALLKDKRSEFSWYNISGQKDNAKFDYAYSREILPPHSNGRRYPTPYFYPNGAKGWFYSSNARAGFDYMIKGRKKEIAAGDHFFSPFISPGINDGHGTNSFYRIRDEDMMRPGQYLGALKALVMMGAEYFHVFQYNKSEPDRPQHIRWSGWQYTTPAYAQAMISYVPELYQNSVLMKGDYQKMDRLQTYRFWAGRHHYLVVAREGKKGTPFENQYLITGTIQTEGDNDISHQELEKVVEVQLTPRHKLNMKIRKQGSTWYLDLRNPQKPVAIQLDGWHDYRYPTKWQQTEKYEAELADFKSGCLMTTMKKALDLATTTTYVSFPVSGAGNCTTKLPKRKVSAVPANILRFRVHHRKRAGKASPTTLIVRARKKSGVSRAEISISGRQGSQPTGVSSNSWKTYSLPYTPAQMNKPFNLDLKVKGAEIDWIKIQ